MMDLERATPWQKLTPLVYGSLLTCSLMVLVIWLGWMLAGWDGYMAGWLLSCLIQFINYPLTSWFWRHRFGQTL